MRELLDTLRADIGIPSQNGIYGCFFLNFYVSNEKNYIDSTTLDAGLEYSQTILKASKFDQDAHNTYHSDRVSDKQETYNILEKFDWTSETEAHSSSFRNNDQRSVTPALSKPTKPNSNFSSEFKKQHSDITQNIDSIRETHRKKSISTSPPTSPKRSSNEKFQSHTELPVESRKTSVVSIITNPKQNNNNHDTISINSASNNNIKSDSNSSFKEDNHKRTVYLSESDDDEKSRSLKFKKEVSVSHQNSSDLDDEGKTDRDEVDKYFMSTLKKPSISEKDEDDEEETQTYTHSIISNKVDHNNNDNKNKKKPSIKNEDDIDFDYNFGEKEDDEDEEEDEEFDKLLTQTTSNKRFQTKNFNQTLKFESHANDDSFNDEKPKPAPRRVPKISEHSDSEDSF